MFDLLEDSLISVEAKDGARRMSLPGVLEALGARDVISFPRFRRHQQDPFHVFLCQVAASALARAGEHDARQPEKFWRGALLDLAHGEATAWQLVVDDPTRPAFMQHPTPTREDFAARFSPKAGTPDELDVLVTAKNHDLKKAKGSAVDIELWLAALLTLQTTAGVFGQGNYGVKRMNTGTGSRAVVSLVSDPAPGPRFHEETTAVLACREEALKSAFGFAANGEVLTWLRAWDGKRSQYALSDLDPLFVEAARPVRLLQSPNGTRAFGATSKCQQIAGPVNGDVGDPWTALNVGDKRKGVSALTISGSGFTASKVVALLLEDGYRLTALQKPREGSPRGPLYLCASVLVRGQGTTEGFHSIQLLIPERARAALFGKGASAQSVAQLSKVLLQDADGIERALERALFAMWKGGAEPQDSKGKDWKRKPKQGVENWCTRAARDFTQHWQDLYFPHLWQAAGRDCNVEVLRNAWTSRLIDMALTLLDSAEQRAPMASARRFRAVTRAQSMLRSALRKHGLSVTKEGTDHVERA